MTAEVAPGRVGIVLRLEVSRLARSNADWYRLIDLCALTDTLIGMQTVSTIRSVQRPTSSWA